MLVLCSSKARISDLLARWHYAQSLRKIVRDCKMWFDAFKWIYMNRDDMSPLDSEGMTYSLEINRKLFKEDYI